MAATLSDLVTQKQTTEPAGVLGIYLAGLLLAVPHCSGPPALHSHEHFVRIAAERFGGDAVYLPNADGKYFICLSRPKVPPGDPRQPVHFVVFDVNCKEVLLEDNLDNAEVHWLDGFRIEVKAVPEVISDDGAEGEGYVFDTVTRTRTPFMFQQKRNQ